MKPVKTHKFNGRRYKIDIDVLDGLVDQYTLHNDRTLRILTGLKTKKGLVTVIHESLHAENWAATEEVVDRVSREIGSFLWRLGYRLKDGKVK